MFGWQRWIMQSGRVGVGSWMILGWCTAVPLFAARASLVAQRGIGYQAFYSRCGKNWKTSFRESASMWPNCNNCTQQFNHELVGPPKVPSRTGTWHCVWQSKVSSPLLCCNKGKYHWNSVAMKCGLYIFVWFWIRFTLKKWALLRMPSPSFLECRGGSTKPKDGSKCH